MQQAIDSFVESYAMHLVALSNIVFLLFITIIVMGKIRRAMIERKARKMRAEWLENWYNMPSAPVPFPTER